jgi:galactonate dehydratase
MRIEKVETFVAHNWTFVQITTDTGLTGVGESTFFSFPDAARAIVESFGEALIGEDPMRVEYHFLRLFRTNSMRGMAITGALSAIDQALWDIRGKHFEEPIWQLLGGRSRDRVRAMLVLNYGSIDEVIAEAKAGVAEGYTALKFLLFRKDHHLMRHGHKLEDLVGQMAAMREAVGWNIDIGVELHRNMVPGEAIALIRELEPFRPLFVEDPIVPDSVIALSQMTPKIRIPIAAGERTTTLWEFREYVGMAGVDHIRPDVGICGGITQMKKICALAEAYHQGIISHSVPNGPVALAAHVHVAVNVPNWELLEHRPQDRKPFTDAVNAIVPVRDGFFDPPDAPGLGVELNHTTLSTIPAATRKTATWMREDGSIAFR